MPNSSRTGFEREFRDAIAPMTQKLGQIEDQIQQSLLAGLQGAERSVGYWRKLDNQLKALYAQMQSVFDNWVKREIPDIYKNALVRVDQQISKLGALANKAKQGLPAMLSSRATTQLAAALYSDASNGFLASILTGQNNVRRFTRLTQQVLLQEGVIDIAVAGGIELGNLRRAITTISGKLSAELFKMVDEKLFVQAGSRRYRPRDYAEIVARTKFHEAQAAASLSQAQNYGTDLVQVSSHNTTTEICIEYEGKVFSISGNDPRFPKLDNTPPYHPNCLHLLFPTFEGAMVQQGTLESFSAFSKDEISRPPTPSGFIPVSQRKAG